MDCWSNERSGINENAPGASLVASFWSSGTQRREKVRVWSANIPEEHKAKLRELARLRAAERYRRKKAQRLTAAIDDGPFQNGVATGNPESVRPGLL